MPRDEQQVQDLALHHCKYNNRHLELDTNENLKANMARARIPALPSGVIVPSLTLTGCCVSS